MEQSILLSIVATLTVLTAVPILGSTLRSGAGGWRRMFPVAGTGALVAGLGVTVVSLTGLAPIPALLAAPVIALGALFAVVAVARIPSDRRTPIIAAIETAVVFVPVAAMVFGPVFDPFGNRVGVLDFAGGLIVVAAASVSLGTGIVLGRGSERKQGGTHSVLCFGALWLIGIVWQVALELAIDEFTPAIALNAALLPLVGILAALAFGRLRRRRFRPNAAALLSRGFLAGFVAALVASAYLTPALAALTGLIVGGVAAGARGGSRDLSLVLGGAVGAVLLGLLATNLGFIYTGQPELAFGQVFAAIVAVGAGLGVGAVVAAVVRVRRG